MVCKGSVVTDQVNTFYYKPFREFVTRRNINKVNSNPQDDNIIKVHGRKRIKVTLFVDVSRNERKEDRIFYFTGRMTSWVTVNGKRKRGGFLTLLEMTLLHNFNGLSDLRTVRNRMVQREIKTNNLFVKSLEIGKTRTEGTVINKIKIGVYGYSGPVKIIKGTIRGGENDGLVISTKQRQKSVTKREKKRSTTYW